MNSYNSYSEEVIYQIVRDRTNQYNVDLREKLIDFAVSVIKMLRIGSVGKEFVVIKYQLSKSATSVGANYEEAQASSYKEFVQKSRIALREANESTYWLKIIQKVDPSESDKIEPLLQEAIEISKILGSIVSKADKNLKTKTIK